ncbi:MAG: hypothetical protein GW855_11545 [Erythrobacter sp.]|nr:hypothetical protein [Erythrobacter sp.]NCQ62776.1 hypothetical protein [Alphaproteobacteria bacterium]
MKQKLLSMCAGVALAAVWAGPVAAQDDAEGKAAEMLMKMLSGESNIDGEELAAAQEEASAFPLGSAENPVRAEMPPGQRAYLSRLRCANLKRPTYQRAGSAGLSPYGNIVDVYVVTCADSEPASREIYIDMYHPGYVETRAVDGYGIVSAVKE